MGWLALLSAVLPGCTGCDKAQEPQRDPAFHSTGDPFSDPAKSGARRRAVTSLETNALSAEERRDIRTRLDSTQCEAAAKHENAVRNLAQTDPRGIDLLASCLKRGNVAWFGCVLDANTVPGIQRCSLRLLLQSEEIPK